jgi:hypothetical protein
MTYEDSGTPPEGCDCCGRDGEDCGMHEVGWVTRTLEAPFPGHYCLGCASTLRLVPWWERCVGCSVTIDDEEQAEAEGWRYYVNSLGELHPVCPSCLAQEAGRPAVGDSADLSDPR